MRISNKAGYFCHSKHHIRKSTNSQPMPIIAVANLKGGVGKSTISQNLAVRFAQQGKKVCIVDTDNEQKSTAEWAERREQRGIEPLVPVFLVREEKLAKEIVRLSKEHEYVMVDGSPALSEVATKIMMVADLVIVPARPSGNDYGALEKFLTRFDDVRALVEKRDYTLELGVVLNEYDSKVIVNRAVMEAIRKLEVRLFDTILAHRAVYQEANLTGQGVTELRDRKASKEIEDLASEVIDRLKG